MSEVRFDAHSFYLNDRKFYPNSGEFHYFRVPKADWERRMRLLKAAGGNTVATYIPWLVHEPEEGKFHIDCGDGYSDLTEFLETAAKTGLYVIARPGPYQYSELTDDGLPPWLIDDYPDLRAKRRDGSDFRKSSVSYCHPLFLEKVHRYFSQIIPILAKYTAPKGGPVILVQPDNETTGIHIWYGSLDFNHETMGFGREDGRYARYLRRCFGTVDRANEVLGTAHKDWREFGPADGKAEGDKALYYRWYHNYFNFYLDQIADYFECLVKMFREFGIDVPFCHNAGAPNMNALLEPVKQRLGDAITIGSDHYYTLGQSWPYNSPTPQYAINSWYSLELLRIMQCPPAVFELPFGSLADWPPVTREDLFANLMLHQAFGMRGHNGYIFTGGGEPPGGSSQQLVYDYVAPVSADGEIRPHYEAVKDFGAWKQSHPETLEDEAVPDFRILMDLNMVRDIHCAADPQIPGLMKPGKLYEKFRLGFLTSACAGAMQGEFISEAQLANMDPAVPVVVPCSGFLSREKQKAVLAFLKRGGKVLCLPCLPRFDEDGVPCTLLSDALGGIASRALTEAECGRHTYDTAFDLEKVWGMCSFAAEHVPEDAEVFAVRTGTKAVTGWSCDCSGGTFMYSGYVWSHAKRQHSVLVERMLAKLGMMQHHTCSDDWILTFLRKDPKGYKLYALNLSTGKRLVKLSWRPDGKSGFREIPETELQPMEVHVFEL